MPQTWPGADPREVFAKRAPAVGGHLVPEGFSKLRKEVPFPSSFCLIYFISFHFISLSVNDTVKHFPRPGGKTFKIWAVLKRPDMHNVSEWLEVHIQDKRMALHFLHLLNLLGVIYLGASFSPMWDAPHKIQSLQSLLP